MLEKETTYKKNRQINAIMCPLSETMDKISSRWKPIILYRLTHSDMGYLQLIRSIPQAQERVLARQLKELIQDNLIDKTEQISSQKSVYSLSVQGRALSPILLNLSAWGKKYRKTYDT